MKHFFTAFLLLCSISLFGQSMMNKKLRRIDSLETALQVSTFDTNRLRLMYDLSVAHDELYQDSLTLFYVEQHLELAKQIKSERHLRQAYTDNIHRIGAKDTLLYQQRYAEAIDYLTKRNDERGIAAAKIALASYYNGGGKNLVLGKSIAEEGLAMSRKLNDDSLRARAFHVLGNIACSDYLLETSSNYLHEALAIGKLSPREVNKSKEIIAINHYYLAQYDSVLVYGQMLEKEYLRTGNLNGVINNTHILYAAYYMMDSVEQRIAYERKLERLVQENELQKGTYANYFLDFGKSAYDEENYQRTIDCSRKALYYYQLPSAKENSSTIYKQLKSYNLLAFSYMQLNEPDSAKLAADHAYIMMDSFYNYKSTEGLQELSVKYQTEKKEYEIERLSQEQEILRTRNQAYIIGSLLLLCTLLLAMWSWWRTKQQNSVIQQQKVELEQLNTTKDQLFAIIGHDLRKPALAFRGISKKINFLLKKQDYQRLQQLGVAIESNAFALNKLTDNLLNWALHQRNVLPNEPRPIRVEQLVDELQTTFEQVVRNKQLQLEIDTRNAAVVYADYNAVITVLRNLVDNAVKFTPRGGAIQVKISPDPDGVKIDVADNGVGILPEQLDELFQLKKNKSRVGTAGEKGTGLGLHLANELVKINRGQLSVASRVGEGTTFSLQLPNGEMVAEYS